MSFDGAGNWTPKTGPYSGINLWTQAALAGEKVRSDRMDAFAVDLKTGFEGLLTRDGQNSPSANLPMNAKKHTGVADAAARDEYAAYGQLLDSVGTPIPNAQVGGSGNAITLTPTTPVTAYAANQTFTFLVQSANTGAVTVAVSGLSPIPLTKAGLIALVANDLRAGAFITIRYDGTRFQLLSGIGPQATPTPASGRTSLYTVGSDGEWATTEIFSIPVSDMSVHAFITLSLGAGANTTSSFVPRTITIPFSVINTDEIPDLTGDTTIVFGSNIEDYRVSMGKNAASTRLYFNPRGGGVDNGKIYGVWGGDF